MNETAVQITRLYRELFGQLIGYLIGRFVSLRMDEAEDIVHDAFAAASLRWPEDGIPGNPAGWLFRTCHNKAVNQLKKASREVLGTANPELTQTGDQPEESVLRDSRLLMLFACCDPDLPPRTHVAVALKYAVNLTVASIAGQLGMLPDALEKLLYRARRKMTREQFVRADRQSDRFGERISSVLKVIYLIFNQGFKNQEAWDDNAQSLCEEALLLNTDLLESRWCNPSVKALQALLLFQIARSGSRFDAQGEPVELEFQNRTQWNKSLISLGHRYLVESEDTTFSPYHLEAAIAYKHSSAPTFEATDWPAICTYYEVLLRIYPSPFAQLNYAVALQYNGQAEKARQILLELSHNAYLRHSRLLNKTLASFYRRAGEMAKAARYETLATTGRRP